MSIQAINWAFQQDIRRSSAKLVLLALADYSNDQNIAYPSFSTLQKKTSCSRDTINNSIRFLTEHRYISKVSLKDHVVKKYSNNQNCYLIIIDDISRINRLSRKSYQSDLQTKYGKFFNTSDSQKNGHKPIEQSKKESSCIVNSLLDDTTSNTIRYNLKTIGISDSKIEKLIEQYIDQLDMLEMCCLITIDYLELSNIENPKSYFYSVLADKKSEVRR